MKKLLLLCCTLAMAVSAAGCGNAGSDSAQKPTADAPAAGSNYATELGKIDQPVTLKISIWGGNLTPSFQENVIDPVQKHFPNLKLEVLDWIPLEQRIVTGDLPDLMTGRDQLLPGMIALGLHEDISPLIKKYNYDLTKINPLLVDKIKDDVDGKTLTGLPTSMLTGNVLYYNKDLFDKFGVAYPKDGMTWDQVYQLAQKMTRNDNGTPYYGYIDRWSQTFFKDYAAVLGLDTVKPNEDAGAMADPGWSRITGLWKQFYELTGIKWTAAGLKPETLWEWFPKTGNVAMAVKPSPALMKQTKINWDIVSAPSFPDQPGVNSVIDGGYFFPLKTSKNQDIAFKLLAYLTSPEYQDLVSRKGNLPVLDDPQLLADFGKDTPDMQGKHLEAYTKAKYAKALPPRKSGLSPTLPSDGFKLTQAGMINMLVKGEDSNTALRQIDESINAKAKGDAGK